MAIKELINSILSGITDEEYTVTTKLNNTDVEIRLHQKDIARIIGRGGKTASAFRTVVEAYAKSNGSCVKLNIEEN